MSTLGEHLEAFLSQNLPKPKRTDGAWVSVGWFTPTAKGWWQLQRFQGLKPETTVVTVGNSARVSPEGAVQHVGITGSFDDQAIPRRLLRIAKANGAVDVIARATSDGFALWRCSTSGSWEKKQVTKADSRDRYPIEVSPAEAVLVTYRADWTRGHLPVAWAVIGIPRSSRRIVQVDRPSPTPAPRSVSASGGQPADIAGLARRALWDVSDESEIPEVAARARGPMPVLLLAVRTRLVQLSKVCEDRAVSFASLVAAPDWPRYPQWTQAAATPRATHMQSWKPPRLANRLNAAKSRYNEAAQAAGVAEAAAGHPAIDFFGVEAVDSWAALEELADLAIRSSVFTLDDLAWLSR